jgi:HSP20 family molecular chaperone IbpA
MYEDVEISRMVAYIELPGLSREEIDVRLTPRHALVISGERRAPPLAQSCIQPVETKDNDSGTGSDVAADRKDTMPVRAVNNRNLHPISEIKFGRFYRTIEVPSRTKVITLSSDLSVYSI